MENGRKYYEKKAKNTDENSNGSVTFYQKKWQTLLNVTLTFMKKLGNYCKCYTISGSKWKNGCISVTRLSKSSDVQSFALYFYPNVT